MKTRSASIVLFLAITAGLWPTPDALAQQNPYTRYEVDQVGPKPAEPDYSYLDIHGTVSMRYRGRWRDDDNDNDLYTYFNIRGNDAYKDDVTFVVFGRVDADLGGSSGDPDPFFELDDTFSGSVNGFLYRAYVDLQNGLMPDTQPVKRVRLGRQDGDLGFIYLFDGISATSHPIEAVGNLEISAFAGIPVRFYEASRSGDWIVGATLEGDLTESTRGEFEYTHINERYESYDGIRDSFSSDYFRFGLTQQIGESLRIQGRYGILEGESREVEIYADFMADAINTDFTAAFLWLAKPQNASALEFDPYFGVLGTWEPYTEIVLRAQTLFDAGFVLSEGVSFRQLVDDNDENFSNREFNRIFATFSVPEWPAEATQISLTGEWWHTDNSDFGAAGLDFLWRMAEQSEASVGLYYSLYKYDLQSRSERFDIYTYYLRARTRFLEDFMLTGSYELEHAEDDIFHTLFLTVSYDF